MYDYSLLHFITLTITTSPDTGAVYNFVMIFKLTKNKRTKSSNKHNGEYSLAIQLYNSFSGTINVKYLTIQCKHILMLRRCD